MVTSPTKQRSAPRITFCGAAQSVTGSMHLLEVGDFKLLLDCGLYRGPRAEARERNSHFPFAPESIDAVVLSHAHIDHGGNLPTLVRQGFSGPIYCTPPTRDLLGLMLADSAKIQEEEQVAHVIAGPGDSRRFGPLYTRHDAELAVDQCVTVAYDEPCAIRTGIDLRLVDAGHVLGSAMIGLTIRHGGREHRVTFTGDLGRRGFRLLRDPAPVPPAELIICESTYGGRTHGTVEQLTAELATVVRRTIDRGGKVLIPAFSLGRAQLVVHFMREGMRLGQIPRVPIYVDSPLAADVSEVYARFPDCLADEALRNPEGGSDFEDSHSVRYVRAIEESRQLSTRREPCVLIASGGMCEGGRVLQHLRHNLDDPRCSVVLVSYQAPHTLGRRLLERGPTVRFLGREWNKWADIVELPGFSGHADQAEILASLAPLVEHTPRVRLVHGEPDQAEALARALRSRGFAEVTIPTREETVTLA